MVAHRQPSLSGGICSRMDSRQFQSQPNALQPMLSKAFRKFDQIHCGSNGTKPTVTEGFDSRRPAFWIVIDARQDGGRIPRECATSPVEEFQVVRITHGKSGCAKAEQRRQRLLRPRRCLPNILDARRNAGHRRVFETIRHSSANRIQIDIRHRREHGPIVTERLTLVAPFPEAPFAAVFAIRTASDRLDEAAHQPRKASQSLP